MCAECKDYPCSFTEVAARKPEAIKKGARIQLVIFVLGISGSPRKDGNTDIVVREALAQLHSKKSVNAKFGRITDFHIKHCAGCRECMHLGYCIIQDDDFGKLWDEILRADVIIEGAPVYWNSPPGVMKDFVDRTHGFFIKPGILNGKKAAIISVATESGFACCETVLQSWLGYYGAEIVDQVRIYAREKGEVLQKPAEMAKIGALVATICERL